MFKRGDPFNIFDPASFESPADPAAFIARVQQDIPAMGEILNDPETMAKIVKGMQEAAAERAKTGETWYQQRLREKREWSEKGLKSEKLKEEGNKAFKNGDYKTAYVIYSACTVLSVHEPLYFLNRAAVALKLKLYDNVVQDTSTAMQRGNFKVAKALFQRAQGRLHLGDRVKADEDYTKALELEPGEPNIVKAFDELKRLRSLPPKEQAAWISRQEKADVWDIFADGELKRRIEELIGYSLDPQRSPSRAELASEEYSEDT
ncbi:TPR-like protein [Mycena metata]|uniref:TPR-like protein n=1 Tax=Mycena metata TaxID=1033252 RepID=A0AAD7JE20_9AGAR|nr:TPR-like protein [Mycena metata]